jgi:hypothetical protein
LPLQWLIGETPTATLAELQTYGAKGIELGLPSLATPR